MASRARLERGGQGAWGTQFKESLHSQGPAGGLDEEGQTTGPRAVGGGGTEERPSETERKENTQKETQAEAKEDPPPPYPTKHMGTTGRASEDAKFGWREGEGRTHT